KCAKCFGDEGVGKVRSEYSDLPYLSKHLKKFHPGDTIIYKCSKCNYTPKGKYHTYRQVKAHFIKCHVSPAEDTAGQSTRGSLEDVHRKSPTTATVSKPRVTSVEIVRLPVKSTIKAGVQSAAKPVRAPSRPPQRTSPEAGDSRPPVTKEKCGEGAVKKLPANKEPPISTRTRRATSVPAEKSEDTARRERVSPHPPRHIENYISLLSSDEEGTQFQPGGVGRLTLKRKKATGPPSKTTSNEGVVTRSRRGGQWTVSVGRRAKRRLHHNNSPSNSESPPTAGPSRSPRIAPLCALIAASTNLHDKSLNVSKTDNNICQAFVVGALGSWDQGNEAVLRLLRVTAQYASMMRHLIVSDTIRCSRDIYVEHVSGTRQYLAPSRPSGDPLSTPPRAVRRRWLAEERSAQDAARRISNVASVA
ncbi:hypothetical protein ALC57_05102, partial [Trachymyrmex cornetzi]